MSKLSVRVSDYYPVPSEAMDGSYRLLALERRRLYDQILGKVQLFAAGAVLVFGAVLKAEAAKYGPLEGLVKWMQSTAWMVAVIGPITVGGVQWLRKKVGNPWAWEAVQKILDEFRNELFDGADDPLDFHRATLFKHYKTSIGWHWPWTQWLVAVARSDHLTKLKIRRFRAPDDAEHCRGIVGHAWRRKGWLVVPRAGNSLPLLTSTSSNDDIVHYAKETCVEAEWVRRQLARGRPLAGSYAALAVKLKGRPWGVIVIDSRGSGPISEEKLERFTAYGSLLTPLLERI